MSITLAFLDEGSATPQSMEVGEALAAAIACAAYVNAGKDAFAVSFTSLFIGLVATRDTTGDWLRKEFARTNADLGRLLSRRGVTIEALPQLPEGLPQSREPLKRTRSARAALEEADRLARAASQPADTAHVITAYLTLPAYHETEFREFGIDRRAWAASCARALPLAPGVAAGAAPAFDPAARGIENHVMLALRLASALAGNAPIEPVHVVSAIWSLAPSAKSAAFSRFVELVPPRVPPATVSPGAMPATERLDPALARQLAIAQRAKPDAAEPGAIWGRDLVTAVLLCPDERVQPVLQDAGRALDAVRERWYVFVKSTSKHRSPEDWAAWWREAGVPLPGLRRAGYAVESDQGEDKLGVDREAQAFARLILDKDVQPPLSIGLLGDWGSGKSFFIEQIKNGIRELKAQGRPEIYTRVVEIEFNAWHASDANLWASLVTEIFDAIWKNVAPADGSDDPRIARERLRKQIEQARGAVHEAEAQVQLGQQALELAERDLEHKREMLAWNRYVTSIAADRLRALAKDAGWHQAIATINDVEHAARALAASGNRLRTVVAVLLERPILNIALPTAVLLVLTAGAWLLVDASALAPWQAKFSKLLATVAGTIGAAVAPLRIARKCIDDFATGLEGIEAEYREKLAAVKETEAGRSQAEAVERARRELGSAEASVDTARARLAELLNQQATLDPRRRLGAFLQDRVRSTQYRAQQGIISLVHKDFSELSKYMKDLRDTAATDAGERGAQDSEAPAGPSAIEPIDRIVIYVDDLDRCRPAHVVNMLEAVHLLLALDLFVVVVAVDSRWLTRALEVYYHDLLTSEGQESDGLRSSTPQNYLEKIFQITYALAPMNPRRFGEYVGFLTGAAAAEVRPGHLTAHAASSGAQGGSKTASASGGPAAVAGAGGQSTAVGSTGAAGQPQRVVPRLAPPVQIDDDERKFITKLVPLLPTPRIAKRLVNVYRVIKARKTAEELDVFEREGRARTCLLMLAILFGRPAIAGELFRALHEATAPFEDGSEPLVAALRRRLPRPGEPPELAAAWARLAATLEAMKIADNVAACAREPHEVARYSLVTGHDWHTWGHEPGEVEAGGT